MDLRHADIMTVYTTGASVQTAGNGNLSYTGVQASETMASIDLQNLNLYKTKIQNVAKKNRVDPALLGGMISRQSCAGSILQCGWGNYGTCFGLMQVDKQYFIPCGQWDSEEHLNQGTEILLKIMKIIKNKFPHWTEEYCLKGAVAAYSCGPDKVVDENIDKNTEGEDFANDVIARAQYFKKHGY